MKCYLAVWYDGFRMNHYEVFAFNAKEAKEKAFREMCDYCGDHINKLYIYEKIGSIDCEGEPNPNPNRAFSHVAKRSYLTGRKVVKKNA